MTIFRKSLASPYDLRFNYNLNRIVGVYRQLKSFLDFFQRKDGGVLLGCYLPGLDIFNCLLQTWLPESQGPPGAPDGKLKATMQTSLFRLLLDGLKHEWGENYEANIEIAKGAWQGALATVGDSELNAGMEDLINETGIGNNPIALKWFHKLAEKIKEGVGE